MWRNRWAYLQQDGIAPVLIGEFGGRSIGSDSEGIWQRSFISFLEQGGFSYTCGVWNPDAWIGDRQSAMAPGGSASGRRL